MPRKTRQKPKPSPESVPGVPAFKSKEDAKRFIAAGIKFLLPRLPGMPAEFPTVDSTEQSGLDALDCLTAALQSPVEDWREWEVNMHMAAALEKGVEWLVARAAGKGKAAEDAQARLMIVARQLCGC